MKKIQKLIGPDSIFLDIEVSDGHEALAVVAEKLAVLSSVKPEVLIDALEERERLGSTSVGDGFAIPHAKLRGLEEILVILVRFLAPVLLNEKDTVRMVAAVISPPDQPAAHLQVLSQIARLLKHQDFRQSLLEAANVDEAVDVLKAMAAREGL